MTYYTLNQINSHPDFAPLGFEKEFNTRIIEDFLKNELKQLNWVKQGWKREEERALNYISPEQIEEEEIEKIKNTLDVDYRKIKKPIHIKWVHSSTPFTKAFNFKNRVYIFTNQTIHSQDKDFPQFNKSVHVYEGRKFWNKEIKDKTVSIVKFNVSRKAEREKYL